jgi:uncharacterized FlaG/YvyC family protein
MEPVHSIPSTVSIPQTVAPRPAPTPVLQAVPTDLTAAKTVTASDTAGAIGSDPRNAQLGLAAATPQSVTQNIGNGQNAQGTQNSQAAQNGQNAQDSQNTSAGTGASSNYQSSVLIDPTTHEVIYRVVDVRTRQVIRQIPDQALLRTQAYNRALQSGKSSAEALSQADIEA